SGSALRPLHLLSTQFSSSKREALAECDRWCLRTRGLKGKCERGDLNQCRSLNAVSSGARAVTTISTQWTLDRPGVAAGRAARGQDEQCEFVVEGVEAAWQHARTRGPRRQPEEPDELEGVAIADARRHHVGACGDACHREAHEVVGEREAPHFLRDAR